MDTVEEGGGGGGGGGDGEGGAHKKLDSSMHSQFHHSETMRIAWQCVAS